MSYQEISTPPAAEAEVQVNENMAALGQSFLWSHDVTADTGLVVGFSGGDFDGNAVTDTTVTATNNTTNYVVAHRTTRALSIATATTNWDNTGTYGRVARVVFASGVLTAFHDERHSVGGIFDHASGSSSLAASAVTVADTGSYFAGTDAEAVLQEIGAALATLGGTTEVDTDEVFTSDTGSTADSDPGNGLFKWNNGTQASATELYFDNQTAAGVSMTTYFASLPQTGYIHLAQDDDATKWQLWRWSVAPIAASGYYKFTGLTLMANGGSIADDKPTSVSFKGVTAGAVTTSGLTMATAKVLARSSASTGAIEEKSLSELLDFIGSAAQGDILYRGAATWTRLGAGTAGQSLKTQGAGANPAWADRPVVASFFYPGVPTASACVLIFAAPAGITTVSYAAAIAGSAGKALTAATAQTDFDVRKNATTSSNGTSVGTIRFAASGTVPTFIAAAGFSLTGGTDYLTVWAPATPDATLANISASLYATAS